MASSTVLIKCRFLRTKLSHTGIELTAARLALYRAAPSRRDSKVPLEKTGKSESNWPRNHPAIPPQTQGRLRRSRFRNSSSLRRPRARKRRAPMRLLCNKDGQLRSTCGCEFTWPTYPPPGCCPYVAGRRPPDIAATQWRSVAALVRHFFIIDTKKQRRRKSK